MGLRAGSDLCDGLISCPGRIHMFQLVNANETGERKARADFTCTLTIVS